MCGHIRSDLIGQNAVFLSFISWVRWIIVSKKQVHKSSGRIELFQLDKNGIKVAEYMTELPKRKLLEHKLHKAVEMARKQLEAIPTNGNTGNR